MGQLANIGEWVASTSSLRYTRPGAITRIGRDLVSIARTWPIRVIAPGRVYRKDEVDATHSPMFHQVEGLVIDKGVTMADLKGTLNTVVEQLYGKGTKTRFRPHPPPLEKGGPKL